MRVVTIGRALLTVAALVGCPAAAAAKQIAQTDPDLINADRPGIADGSGLIARGQLQIEIGFQREFRDNAGTKTRTSFLPALVRVGMSRRFEGRVETNAYTWLEATDATSVSHSSGWASASLGLKYRVYDANESHRPSVGAIVRVFPSSGSTEFGTGHVTADARLAADFSLSRTLSVNPNVGIARYEGANGQTFAAALFAATLSYQPSERINPFIDIAFQSPADAGASASVILDVGLGYIIGRNLQLDVSVGTGTSGAARPFVSFGMSVRSHR